MSFFDQLKFSTSREWDPNPAQPKIPEAMPTTGPKGHSPTESSPQASEGTLEALLGIDPDSRSAKHAERLVARDRWLLSQLVGVRKVRKLSQQDVADKMGRHLVDIEQFEAMDANPTQGMIRRYAHAVGMEIVYEVSLMEDYEDDRQKKLWE